MNIPAHHSYRITWFFFCIDIFSKNDYKRKNVTLVKRARALLNEECYENFEGEL